MQNLFLKLSQTLARLTGEDTQAKLKSLQVRVDVLERRNAHLLVEFSKIALIVEQQKKMQESIKELNAITNIVLSVQQQLLEDLAYNTAPSAPTKKGTGIMVLPLVSSDDDDLPN